MAQQAVDADVHVVGISSLAGGHKVLVPKVHVRTIRDMAYNSLMQCSQAHNWYQWDSYKHLYHSGFYLGIYSGGRSYGVCSWIGCCDQGMFSQDLF